MKTFALYAALVVQTLALASFPTIPPDTTTPVQQRLAISGPNSVTIGWNTYVNLPKACVKFGTDKNNLVQESCSPASTIYTYPTSRTWTNTVQLDGLQPATTYYYQIVSTNSTVEKFLSPRPPGDKTPFNFSVVIDLGVYGQDGYTLKSQRRSEDFPEVQPELSHATIGALAATFNDYELVVHPGDFAYADDWYLKIKNVLSGKEAFQAILEQFYIQLAPIAGRKPYMVSPGNHEAACEEIPYVNRFCPDGQKNFTDFMFRFRDMLPRTFQTSSPSEAAKKQAQLAKTLANPPFWYSFEYGLTHIVMIDTETDFEGAPDTADGSAHLNGGPFGSKEQQLKFLEADLASVDRNITPWVIVAGHRPWYTTGDEACTACQTTFEPLLYKYGVDLGIFGHVHNSQRHKPLYNGTVDPAGLVNPKAPLYIVAGGAGNIEGISAIKSKPNYTDFAYADDFSYATIGVKDSQNLQVSFFNSKTLEMLDTATLSKSHADRFVRQSV